jgi:uncharacterized LabA/DUF88 family protein
MHSNSEMAVGRAPDQVSSSYEFEERHRSEHIDHLVLFSGDGDFRPLAETVQRRGVRVTFNPGMAR